MKYKNTPDQKYIHFLCQTYFHCSSKNKIIFKKVVTSLLYKKEKILDFIELHEDKELLIIFYEEEEFLK